MSLATFFNPIIVNDDGATVVIHNKQEAEFMAEQWLKIANDCAKLVNTTKNPDVFFPRYSLLIEEMNKLVKVQSLIHFNDKLPSQNLQEIESKKVNTINDFLNRYCEDVIEKISKVKNLQTKRNRADKFFQSLKQYDNQMLDENIQTYHFLYEKLVQSIIAEQITIKHCPYCNKVIDINSKFCNYCGAKMY